MNQTYGYARVSTADQNTDTQIEILKKFGCHFLFEDKVSGTTQSRPDLDRMLSFLRPGDTVVVSRLNRLGRNRSHLIHLVDELIKKGVIFKALDLGIDTATPTGKMIIGLFAVLADYDREEIVEKSRNGQRLAKEQGKHIGRPAGVDEEAFGKVVKAYGLGMSVTETVAMTGVSASSVKRYRKAWDALPR